MLVKDLQQFLGSFTDKLKGNAISNAKIYIEKDGFLEEIKRMEVQEHTLIGQSGMRLVLKTHNEKKLHLDVKLIKPYWGEKMEITNDQRKQLLAYLSSKPYAEVFQLVAMLVSLKPEPVKTNGKKKDDVTSKN